MPDFYYQIKGREYSEGSVSWAWPPVFSGMVAAADRKKAKAQIEKNYGRKFPGRVLKTDQEQHAYLLHIREVEPDNDYLLRRFRKTVCKVCGTIFIPIDKYNDPHSDHQGLEYCSDHCSKEGRFREVQEFRLAHEGKLPPVIYQVRQKSTGRVYVGQSIRPFTLRWWEHLTYPSESKFHETLRATPITDWEFSVLEVVSVPDDCKSKAGYITDRERYWIDALNAVVDGFNSVLPTGVSPQLCLIE